jgi:hypothetical protein
MSVAMVEQMSVREFEGWFEFYRDEAGRHAVAANDDGALDMSTLTKAQLRRMFHHGK